MGEEGQRAEINNPNEANSLRKSQLVDFLREQLGKPYHYGVDSEATGNKVFDCSSIVKEAYRIIGIEVARTSVNQATYFGRVVEESEDYEIGDLLFFTGETGYYNPQYPQGIGHEAIYVGSGRVIHTTSWYDEGVEKGEVIEESVEDALSRRTEMSADKVDDLVVVKRVLEDDMYWHEGEKKPISSVSNNR